MTNVIHRNCLIAVSFQYNDKSDLFTVKSIFLDKREIETRHSLIGLKRNFCQYLPSFSVRKFKFRAMTKCVEDYKLKIMEYRKQIEHERLRLYPRVTFSKAELSALSIMIFT